jgi:predicted kinase
MSVRREPRVLPGSRPAGLIVLAGLPGSGKSTLARRLARQIGAVWLRVDTLEAAMLAAGIPRSHATGLAAYLGVRDQAREQLAQGLWVVIDAVNGVPEGRRLWRELSSELSVDRWVVELVVSDRREHRRRVQSRRSPTPPLPPPTWPEVEEREYVPWDEPVLTVDTTLPLESNLRRVRAYLRTRPAGGARSRRRGGTRT